MLSPTSISCFPATPVFGSPPHQFEKVTGEVSDQKANSVVLPVSAPKKERAANKLGCCQSVCIEMV